MFTSYSAFAQYHDNVWTFGYSSNLDTTTFGGTNIYFDGDEVSCEYQFRDIEFVGNLTASISDTEGNLLMMFNGCTLNDVQHSVVKGSETLVKNDTQIEQDWWCLRGYNNPGGAIFIPDPYEDKRYYLFYRDVIEIEEKPYITSDSLYVAEIYLEDEMPIVTKKYSILADTISIVSSATVRHANGLDWWLYFKHQYENKYNIIQLDEDGPHFESVSFINEKPNTLNSGTTRKISGDGKYFATFDPFQQLEIFSIDRVTGKLSPYINIPTWVDGIKNKIIDLEFSPSGRYLYAAAQDTLWQFDIWVDKEDFYDTKTVVGIYDGFIDFFPTNFWLMQTARDGKIYMSSRNGTKFLHVIHQPDEAGEACDFRQHDYELPTVNSFAMPYFPNYRLGADPTYVSTEEVVERERAVIYPNPAQDYISVQGDNISSITIKDINGQVLINSKNRRLAVDKLPSGIYLLEVGTSTMKETHKLVIQR